MRKPFYRKSHKCWYVKSPGGAFIRLDPDEDKAFDQWQRMRDLARFRDQDATIEATCEGWLDEHKATLSSARWKDCVSVLKSFCLFVGPRKETRTITKADFLRWLGAKKQIGKKQAVWSVARKRDAGQVVKRVFRWAFHHGYLTTNRLAEARLETPASRVATVPPEIHRQLIEECRALDRSKPFGLFLIACHCGARPINIREVTRDNVSPCGKMWIFQKHKTVKKTGKPLVVYLHPCLQTLTKILVAHRENHLFLSAKGEPYSKDGVVHRLARMREKLGIDVIAYNYRHTFATDALLAGNDVVTVAALLGHTDTSMVSKVYGHVESNIKHMEAAAAKTAKKRLE